MFPAGGLPCSNWLFFMSKKAFRKQACNCVFEEEINSILQYQAGLGGLGLRGAGTGRV